jgi:hypothetical protein
MVAATVRRRGESWQAIVNFRDVQLRELTPDMLDRSCADAGYPSGRRPTATRHRRASSTPTARMA